MEEPSAVALPLLLRRRWRRRRREQQQQRRQLAEAGINSRRLVVEESALMEEDSELAACGRAASVRVCRRWRVLSPPPRHAHGRTSEREPCKGAARASSLEPQKWRRWLSSARQAFQWHVAERARGGVVRLARAARWAASDPYRPHGAGAHARGLAPCSRLATWSRLRRDMTRGWVCFYICQVRLGLHQIKQLCSAAGLLQVSQATVLTERKSSSLDSGSPFR
jgi:hypothetical protein